MKLYAMFGTCALAPNIVSQWLNAPVEIVNLKRGDHLKPDYLTINPHGQVPALEIKQGVILTEASAILMYLARTSDDNSLNPNDPLSWARIAEALSFMTSEVHAHYAGHFAADRLAESEDAQNQVRAATYIKLAKDYGHLEKRLIKAGGQWYLGERSVADAYLYVLLRWTELTPIALSDFPTLHALKQRMDADPMVLQAMTLQKMV